MSFKINKSLSVFLFLFLVGSIISIFSYFILPERFFYDTAILVYDEHNEIGLKGSYPFSIWFYHVSGLKHLHFSVIGFIQYSIVVFLLYKIGLPQNFYKLNIKNVLVFLAFLMIGIFLSMPTKEFITFLYLALIVFFYKERKYSIRGIILIIVSLVFFGYFFRPYYILVAILSVVFYVVSRVNFKNKKLATFFYGLSIAIMMSLSYGIIKGKFISQETREDLNEFRAGAEATNSAIVSPISTDTWYGESFGIVYGFFTVNLPFNAIFKHILSPQILVFSLWQLAFFVILIIRYDRCLKKGIIKNKEIWMFYIMFSFFIVQGVFEPDLGSVIRHKMGFFPIIYFILYYDSFRKKIS